MSENTEYCDICDRELKTFMHTCPDSPDVVEIYGCPYHDDVCGYCKQGDDDCTEDYREYDDEC